LYNGEHSASLQEVPGLQAQHRLLMIIFLKAFWPKKLSPQNRDQEVTSLVYGPFERWREGRRKTKEKPKARGGPPDMSGVLPMQLS
jgi:hypothetical protein